MAGSAGSRGWPRRPARWSAVAPASWTSRPTRGDASTSTRVPSGAPPIPACWWRWTGYRVRAWKTELARLATETGLQITVCHLPPGTSKWNKIEVRHEASPGREGVEDLLSCAVAAA